MEGSLSGRHNLFRFLTLGLTMALIVYLIPKEGKFKYEFEKGRPWQHEDLIAPFSFAVEKTSDELKQERDKAIESFLPYYRIKPAVPEQQAKQFEELIQRINQKNVKDTSLIAHYRQEGLAILEHVYQKGIAEKPFSEVQNRENPNLILIDNQLATKKSLADYYTIDEVEDYIYEKAAEDSLLTSPVFINAVRSSLKPNIVFDQELSKKKLEEDLSNISYTRGMIQDGEKIIARGNIVTDEKYQVLLSLKNEYESKVVDSSLSYLITAGYMLLVVSLITAFGFYIQFFKVDVLQDNKSVLLIVINIIIFIIASVFVSEQEDLSIYLIPYSMLPIVLIAFFGPRISFVTHILVVLIVGLFIPNSFEFAFLQVSAGFVAVLSMTKVRYLSQFFVACLLILITYIINYFGLNIIKTGNLNEFDWYQLLWFGGNFLLTLIAYPIIYGYEKLFGFTSDITLIELSDLNKSLLRKLSTRAPGTFQHSLQVANLAESVLNEIGGNSLLARVGALYHDIGKMEQPEYFIENQTNNNLHEECEPKESASIIINHVTHGVELANKYNLPDSIIQFIISHHGTSRVEFFYRKQIEEYGEVDTDEADFRYKGQKPKTKEAAVMMIVDSIEAASRSLKKHNSETIDALVDGIINAKIKDNQLAEADISFKDLLLMRKKLKAQLKSIYHVRPEYPS